jgi:hypothetical protein
VRAIAWRIVELEAAKFPHPTWYKNSARSQKNSRATRTATFADFNPAANQSRSRMEGDGARWKATARAQARELIVELHALDEGGRRRRG